MEGNVRGSRWGSSGKPGGSLHGHRTSSQKVGLSATFGHVWGSRGAEAYDLTWPGTWSSCGEFEEAKNLKVEAVNSEEGVDE